MSEDKQEGAVVIPAGATVLLDPSTNTREWIKLSLKGLRWEMRALFILSVAGNQVLAHASYGPAVGFSGAALVIGTKILLTTLHHGR